MCVRVAAPKPAGRRCRKPGLDRKPRQAYSARQLERLETEFKVRDRETLQTTAFMEGGTQFLPTRPPQQDRLPPAPYHSAYTGISIVV